MFIFENKVSNTPLIFNVFFISDVGIYSSEYSFQYA